MTSKKHLTKIALQTVKVSPFPSAPIRQTSRSLSEQARNNSSQHFPPSPCSHLTTLSAGTYFSHIPCPPNPFCNLMLIPSSFLLYIHHFYIFSRSVEDCRNIYTYFLKPVFSSFSLMNTTEDRIYSRTKLDDTRLSILVPISKASSVHGHQCTLWIKYWRARRTKIKRGVVGDHISILNRLLETLECTCEQTGSLLLSWPGDVSDISLLDDSEGSQHRHRNAFSLHLDGQ